LHTKDTSHSDRSTKLLICLGLVAVTLVAYEPIRHNSFVSYDDRAYITQNPHVKDGITQQSIVWAFRKAYLGNWYPLTWLSHMLDFELFGSNPLGHHATNVLLHTGATLLLFLALLRMTCAMWRSAFVAVVFALHPLHVESVAWAAERKDVLSAFFWMLTMLLYTWYVEHRSVPRYLAVFAAFVMASMSKPMVVTLPFVLLLLDYWPLDRIAWRREPTDEHPLDVASEKRSGRRARIGRLIAEKSPFFAVAAGLSIVTFTAQRAAGAVNLLEATPLRQRIANVFLSYVEYIAKTVWPAGLVVFYPSPQTHLSEAAVAVCAIVLFAATVLSVILGLRRRYVLIGWLWYVGTLVPVIGLIQVGSQAMADRYMYIPMVGLLIIVAWTIGDLVAVRSVGKMATLALSVVVLGAMVVLTRVQVGYWRDNLTLFGRALEVTSNNAVAENQYGCALWEAGRLDEAIPHISSALRISPTSFNARNNLGKIYLQKGRYGEAIEVLNGLVERKQDNSEIHANLATAYALEGRYDMAMESWRKAVDMDHSRAGAAAEISLDIGGAFLKSRENLAKILLNRGRYNEAVLCLKELTERNPAMAELFDNLGVAYTQTGAYGKAVECWTRAIELNSNNAETLNNLAWLLAATGDVSAPNAGRAVEYAQHACELTQYKEPTYLDTLAVAYAAGGKFADATATAEKALKEARAAGLKEVASEIEERMKLYQKGLPYRME